MGFELMDLLQSTVFKFRIKSLYFMILIFTIFRNEIIITKLEAASYSTWNVDCGKDLRAEARPPLTNGTCNKLTAATIMVRQ